MNSPASDSSAPLRRGIYALLIVASCAAATGRILTLDSAKTPRQESTPFLSANDRSRWSTLRALVDEGTFVLDDVIFNEQGRRRPEWYSIDLVRHRGWDGREHFYSSKPTLLTVLMAGEYWLVKSTTGATLAEEPLFVGRLMLVLTNVGLLLIFLLSLVQLVERYGTTDWGRIFVIACAAFATFLTTFAVSLNNHLPAAVTALLTVQLALRIWREPTTPWWCFIAAGLTAALTAANELPALALLAMVAVALLWRSPLKTLLGFAPAAALVAAAALGTNYYAHGSWKTPYAHRGDGAVIEMLDGDDSRDLDAQKIPMSLHAALVSKHEPLSEETTVFVKIPGRRWVVWDEREQRRYAVVRDEPSGQLLLRQWDNWYDYEGSYWTDEAKQGVDKGERAHYPKNRWLPAAIDETRIVYALHCLVGHHGVLSLTPIWLLSLCGLWHLWFRPEQELRGFSLLTAVLTLVVFTFYTAIVRDDDLNYGGVSSGLRWMFWFIPLWLVAMLPAADKIAPRRNWRWFALGLFAVSVVSSHYAALNPWSHPWIFDYWTYLGWIKY